MKISYRISLILAVIFGLIIAWIDSRPHWDDTGISVLMVLLASASIGFIANKTPWLIALLVGTWIPLYCILLFHNFGSLLALVPAFIGAFFGYFIKKQIIMDK